jgi:GNAT superfamily N-acetyltransferase
MPDSAVSLSDLQTLPARLLVRDARPADAARLSEFMTTTFLAANGHCSSEDNVRAHVLRSFAPERQHAEIVSGDRVTLLATLDSAWAGYAQLRLGVPLPAAVSGVSALLHGVERAAAELARFYLDARHHGTGAATRLLQETLARAHAGGARALWLCVWEESARAIRFYQKHGFEALAATEALIGAARTPHLLMARALA